MPIDWRMLNTQFPQQLSDLFNPAAIQQRQAAVSDQQTMGQLRQAQLMEAAQGLRRQPELARREDLAYAQQQEGMQAQQANALRKQKLMEQLNAPNVPPQIKQQIFTQLYPEEAAKQAFKPIEPTKPEAPVNWSTVQTEKGLVQVNPVTGATRPLGLRSPPKTQGAAALSPTAQKELFEADDTIQSARNVQSILSEASKLNNVAYSGYGAKARAVARSNLPGQSPEADATINLDNMMTGQALESLKLIFGGMPTEGERKILMEMQASSDKTPQQRQDIINRAMQAAKRREVVNQNKAKALREGTYFSENPQDQEQPIQAPTGGAKFLGFE